MLNNNYQSILIKFGIWLGILIFTCIIGISGVFAYTYEDVGFFTDKSQVQVEINYLDTPVTVPLNAAYQLEEVRSLDIFVSNINLTPDYVYFFEIYLPNTILTRANSAVVFDQTGSQEKECTVITTYFTNNYPHVTFKCNSTSNINSLYIKIFNSNNQYLFDPHIFTWNYTFMRKRLPESNDNTGEIIDGIQQNTQSIINNDNQNTTKIIESQQQLLGECNTNIYTNNRVNSLSNLTYQNGKYIQSQADTNNSPNLKLQYFNNGTFVGNNDYTPTISVNRFKYTFVKNSSFNQINFGLNGSSIDTTINYNVSNLTNQQLYTLIFDIENATNGQVVISNIMLFKGNSIFNEYIPEGESKCISKIDSQINNANQNKQDIIDNQNKNTQDLIDDNKKNFQTCRESVNLFDKDNVTIYNAYMDNSSWLPANDSKSIRIPVQPNTTYTVSTKQSLTIFRVAWTTSENVPSSNTRIPVYGQVRQTNNTPITITTGNNAKYIIIQINISSTETAIQTLQVQEGNAATDYDPYGEEICVNKLDEQNKQLNDLNDNIKDDDIGDSASDGADFILDFDTNTFGLTSIISAPLNLINSLTSSTCVPLHLPLPYLDNQYLDLPCMTTIYQTHFGAFFTLYQTITYGIIAYWICVRIFNQVKDFKNPEHDEIEVVDL